MNEEIHVHPEQERRLSLVEGLARAVHEADAGTTSPQPLSTSECTTKVGSQPEELSIRQLLVRIDARMEALTNLAVPRAIDAPATTPEAVITPDGPLPPGLKPLSTTSAAQRKTWKHCPSLGPYVKGATMQKPLSVLDLQDAIRVKTGYAPSLPALQNQLWKLAEKGKIETYIGDRGGNLTPYRVRRSKFELYIVWQGGKAAAPQPAPSGSPEPGGADGTHMGSGSPSSPVTDVGAAFNPRPQTAGNDVVAPTTGLSGWLRRISGRKINTQTAR